MIYAPRRTGFVPAYAMTRASGAVGDPATGDAALVTIPQNERIVDPRVREVQRQMLGVGITVGPQGADGRLSVNTANGLQSFARWYNTLPEGPMLDPRDLKRGPLLTVDRTLSPEKQIALRRFAARASDVLTSVQYETRNSVVPATPIPWGTVALVSAATGALLLGLVYVVNDSSKKKAPK